MHARFDQSYARSIAFPIGKDEDIPATLTFGSQEDIVDFRRLLHRLAGVPI